MSENIKKQSLIEVIEDSIRKNWKLPAYSDYGTDTSYTYGDVARNIARLHSIYKECGIGPGDRICLCAKNSSRWAIAALSVITYEAVLVPVLSDFSVEQIRNIYDHSGSSLMICDAHLQQEFPEAMDIGNLSFFDGRKAPQLADFAKLKAKKVSYFRENADKKFYRLSIDREVRLKYAYIIKCTHIVKDEDGHIVGEITDFEPIPGNPCLYVKHGDDSVMIPLHEDLVIDLDEDSMIIALDLPEGLF